MRLTKGIAILAFALAATANLTAQYFERPRSFYLEAGIGFFPYLTYGSAVDASLRSPGMSRFQLAVDAHAGWPLTRRFLVVGGYDGVLDEIFENGTFTNQISSSLFSLGFRIYPLGAGLVLGADAGLSELDGFVALGYGFGGTAAWDFSPLGLNVEVGAKTLYLNFNYESPQSMFVVMPFVCLVLG